MTVKIKINEIAFSSSTQQIEAYRRSTEIREMSLPKNGTSSVGRWEKFVWRTDTESGYELEEVLFDKFEGVISYTLSEREVA
jgi:hypothetical protein